MSDIITKDQVLAAYNEAPDLVRAAFNDPKTTELIMSFKNKYNLHVDQVGTLSKLTGYLLLGLLTSEQFSRKLIESNFSQETVLQLVKELNEKVFLPIHTQEKNEAKEPTFFEEKNQNHIPITDPERELPVGEGPSINSLKNEIPSNLPGTMPSQQTPQMPSAAPVTAVAPMPNPVQNGPKPKIKVPAPDITSYSIDPYREPLDEDKAS